MLCLIQFYKMRKELDRIANRIKRTINGKYDLIFSQINTDNIGNKDVVNVGLLSLFVVSRDIINNSINSRNKNDYYSANILIRKVFENSLIYIRLHDIQKLGDYFQLCNEVKSENIIKFDKSTQKTKKDSFFNLSNIKESRNHFVKINSNVAQEIIDKKYSRLCEFTHFNLLQIGQYKHHLKQFQIDKKNIWSYDSEFDKETIGHIMLSVENLIFAIEHSCKNKKKYDKKIFDKLYKLIEKN